MFNYELRSSELIKIGKFKDAFVDYVRFLVKHCVIISDSIVIQLDRLYSL